MIRGLRLCEMQEGNPPIGFGRAIRINELAAEVLLNTPSK